MNRLKELRKQKNLTLKELGHKIGMLDSTLSQYENEKRNPSNEIWQKLADFYDVPVCYLRGEIDTDLIAKIAKMAFIIQTAPFYTNYGFTNNLYDNSKMVCSLMMLLLKQINSNCSHELKTIILCVQEILNDERFKNIYCSAKVETPVSYQTAKKSIEDITGAIDKDNFENTIKEAKGLIELYNNLLGGK